MYYVITETDVYERTDEEYGTALVFTSLVFGTRTLVHENLLNRKLKNHRWDITTTPVVAEAFAEAFKAQLKYEPIHSRA